MTRKGVITTIHDDGSGIIMDENEQEISFNSENIVIQTLSGATVNFRIELVSSGLTAVAIEVIGSS